MKDKRQTTASHQRTSTSTSPGHFTSTLRNLSPACLICPRYPTIVTLQVPVLDGWVTAQPAATCLYSGFPSGSCQRPEVYPHFATNHKELLASKFSKSIVLTQRLQLHQHAGQISSRVKLASRDSGQLQCQ